MKRIVFVCHGNICRSPMAEFLFKDLVKKAGAEDRFHIESRATSSEEIVGGEGRPVYPNARAMLASHGISCEGKTAQQLKEADLDRFDLFIGMDSANYRNMHRILGVAEPDSRIHKLLEYAGRTDDVADPWYTRSFDVAFRDIEDGCNGLLKLLLSED